MILVIYRDKKTRAIKSVQEIKDDIEIPKIEERIKQFNNEEKDTIACLQIVYENSLEAFLYRTKEVNVCNFKESLKYIQRSVEDLSDSLQWLDSCTRKVVKNNENR